MNRTLGIRIITLLIGILAGGLIVHKHHQSLWKKQFDKNKGAFFIKDKGPGLRGERLPPQIFDRLGEDLFSSDQALAKKIEDFPLYQSLSIQERSQFLEKIQKFRTQQIELSQSKMKELGLHLNEDESTRFYQSHFEKRRNAMKSAREHSKKILEELEKKSDEALRLEFTQ